MNHLNSKSAIATMFSWQFAHSRWTGALNPFDVGALFEGDRI